MPHQVLVERPLVLEEQLLLAPGHLVERRLRHVEVAAGDELRHLPVEEGQQQRADVASVHVRVGHEDDPVVAGLVRLVVLADLADPRSQGGDQGHDLLGGEHLLEAGLLHVEDLPSQRKDGLVAPVAALLGRATGRVTLDDVELALAGVLALAVGQLAGERHPVQHALAADGLPGLAGGDPGPHRVADLGDDLPGPVGVLLQPVEELLVDHLLHQALDLGVAELGLGLPLELGVGELDADHRRQALTGILAGGRLLEVLPGAVALGVAVDGPGQRALEADQVRAALLGVDVVGEGVQTLVVGVVPLHRDLQVHPVLLGAEEDRWVEHFLGAVDELHEADDAALELEEVRLLGPLVGDADLQTRR